MLFLRVSVFMCVFVEATQFDCSTSGIRMFDGLGTVWRVVAVVKESRPSYYGANYGALL